MRPAGYPEEARREESIRTLKARLRREGTRKRDALTLEERTLKSQVICRALMETSAWKRAEAVLTYMNFRSEVITDSLVKAALLEGKKVYAPRILDSGISGAMEFFAVTDPDALMVSPIGIREPLPDEAKRFLPGLFPKDKVLVVVPGTVFDEKRGRIGYAGGYYDRFLSEAEGLKTTALSCDCQIIPAVPMEEHDVRPQIIMTETRIIE